MDIIFEDDALRITYIDRGSSNNVLICFTDAGLEMGHVGEAMERAQANPEQFVRTSALLHCSALYVTDKTVSWGNHIDFHDIAARVASLIEGKQVTILGVSMGGFNAIAATQYIDARLCMAFCPQFSVDPTIMPREHRYDAFVSQIKAFKIPSLANSFNGSCAYYTFNGSEGADKYHWERFPVLPNARHFVFPEIDHRVARELRQRDVLVPLIAGCMRGDEPGGILSGKVAYFIHEIEAV